VESLAECPSLMTHASVPDGQRALLGIDDTLIRLSVGVESCSDLIADLENALDASLPQKEMQQFIPQNIARSNSAEGNYWDW